MTKEIAHFRLRLPKDLHDRIAQEADRSQATINATICDALVAAFPPGNLPSQVIDLLENLSVGIGYGDETDLVKIKAQIDLALTALTQYEEYNEAALMERLRKILQRSDFTLSPTPPDKPE